MGNRILAITLLILLNMVAHFVPFERAALAPDDYAVLARANPGSSSLVARAIYSPDRPLLQAVLSLQARVVGDSPQTGLIVVFISSTLVLLAVFCLFKELFANEFSALVGTVLFCLMPYTLETYHGAINVNIVLGSYILSLLLFIVFTRTHKRLYLLISVAAYAVGIFWYEVGFFTPAIVVAYAWMYDKNVAKVTFLFVLVAVIYLIYRFIGPFYFLHVGMPSHNVSVTMLLPNILDLLQHFVGRYMARNILYGSYKFLSIETPWLIAIMVSNLVLIAVGIIGLRQKDLGPIDKRLPRLGAVIFIAFIIPILVNDKGGVGSRHLVLPSIAVAIWGLCFLEKLKSHWQVGFLSLMAPMLIVSQGNAWCQVIASRINGAVYETMKEKKADLLHADRVIVDTRSFAEWIPFTWIQRDFNVLNTYYGAQAFEDWGLVSMVRLVTDNPQKKVYIAVESPRLVQHRVLEFAVSEHQGYRSSSKLVEQVGAENTVIIDFQSVYGRSFNNGLRDSRPR